MQHQVLKNVDRALSGPLGNRDGLTREDASVSCGGALLIFCMSSRSAIWNPAGQASVSAPTGRSPTGRAPHGVGVRLWPPPRKRGYGRQGGGWTMLAPSIEHTPTHRARQLGLLCRKHLQANDWEPPPPPPTPSWKLPPPTPVPPPSIEELRERAADLRRQSAEISGSERAAPPATVQLGILLLEKVFQNLTTPLPRALVSRDKHPVRAPTASLPGPRSLTLVLRADPALGSSSRYSFRTSSSCSSSGIQRGRAPSTSRRCGSTCDRCVYFLFFLTPGNSWVMAATNPH